MSVRVEREKTMDVAKKKLEPAADASCHRNQASKLLLIEKDWDSNPGNWLEGNTIRIRTNSHTITANEYTHNRMPCVLYFISIVQKIEKKHCNHVYFTYLFLSYK